MIGNDYIDFGVKACCCDVQSVSKSSFRVSQRHTTRLVIHNHVRTPIYHKHPLHKERARASEYNCLARVHRLFSILKRILSIHVHAHKSWSHSSCTGLIIIIVSVRRIVCWLSEAFGLFVDHIVDCGEWKLCIVSVRDLWSVRSADLCGIGRDFWNNSAL